MGWKMVFEAPARRHSAAPMERLDRVAAAGVGRKWPAGGLANTHIIGAGWEPEAGSQETPVVKGKNKDRVQRSYFLDRDIDKALRRMALEEEKIWRKLLTKCYGKAWQNICKDNDKEKIDKTNNQSL